MKPITHGLCSVLLMLITINGFAQKTTSKKPFLFSDYPAVISCSEEQLNSLFATDDLKVNLSLPGNLTLEGEITSKSTKYNSLRTVAVKLPAFGNILFSATKRDDAGRKPVYTAYLLNTNYADGYQLKHNADDTYQFIKIENCKTVTNLQPVITKAAIQLTNKTSCFMKIKIFQTIFLFTILSSHTVSSQVKLNSYPSAPATIYLDFDGEQVNNALWNNGATIDCAAAGLNNEQLTEIFNRVSEDFRPFNINITTDLDVFVAAPFDKRIRVIITPTSGWFTGVGGVSYSGSFTWGDDTPCFVFCDRLGPNNAKMVAECCSHESGHSLGLSHQSRYDGSCNLTATYNEGNGAGEIAWAPIMGNSYYRNMSGWNNGPTPYGCSNMQDNLSIITSSNGFTYREDDHKDDINNTATALNPSSIHVDGLISTSNDKDAFTFTLSQSTNFHLDAKPFSVNANNEGADLDIKISLYNAAKTLIQIYDPAEAMSVTIDTILNAGTYFMVVDGTGNNNASEYGSLGSYTITSVPGVLPICSVNLTGAVTQNKHQLNWNLVCYETISNVSIQASTDAIDFTNINIVDHKQDAFFTYVPFLQRDTYYRLKITSLSGKSVYSNTVLLRKTNQQTGSFAVSSFVTNEITVIAAENFQYQLLDANGSSFGKGSGTTGFNKINMSGKASGMYVLQLAGNHQRQTERVIKQ